MNPAPRLVQLALPVGFGTFRIVNAFVHRAVVEVFAAVANVRGNTEIFTRTFDELWARFEAARRIAEESFRVAAVALNPGTRLVFCTQHV